MHVGAQHTFKEKELMSNTSLWLSSNPSEAVRMHTQVMSPSYPLVTAPPQGPIHMAQSQWQGCEIEGNEASAIFKEPFSISSTAC